MRAILGPSACLCLHLGMPGLSPALQDWTCSGCRETHVNDNRWLRPDTTLGCPGLSLWGCWVLAFSQQSLEPGHKQTQKCLFNLQSVLSVSLNLEILMIARGSLEFLC